MLKRIECANREEWLAARAAQGIGGSEAAAVVGMSNWETPVELWRLKTGQTEAKDLSGNDAVRLGVRMEPILRDFYIADHPEYTLDYHPYDILYQEERPWIFATLDGELTDKDGRKGILEIKTGTPNGKAGWEAWSNGKMPKNYFCQAVHQLLATGYDFARLFACLYSMDGTKTLKEYEIERSDVFQDMEWLLTEEERFMGYVQRREMPPMPLLL